MAFVVDAARFQAEGTLISWADLARRLGYSARLANVRQLDAALHLRWMIRADLGMPTGPFIVWRRSRAGRTPTPLNFDVSPLGFFFGSRLVDWHASMSMVEMDVTGSAGVVIAFAGSPQLSQTVAIANVPGGATTLELSASSIDGLIVSPGIDIVQIRGIVADDLSEAAGWERIELVGLPVRKAAWAGVQHHAEPQGMMNALTTPEDAARQRLERGAPPIGWGPWLDAGVPAPPWTPPNYAHLIDDTNLDLLAFLRSVIVGFPPNQQIAQQLTVPLPPPQNAAGQTMNEPGTSTKVSPLAMTLLPAGTDPHLSLALGFGTAYPIGPRSKLTVFTTADVLHYDYMITAQWERGLDGNSASFDMAALVPTPSLAIAPPAPSNLITKTMGHLRPPQPDGDWSCSVRVSWDRPPAIPLFNPRTFAFARVGLSPVEAPGLLMENRKSGGHLPITINETIDPPDPEQFRLHAVHRDVPIPSNPGYRTNKYAAAHQDIYGQWSNWRAIDTTIQQPPVDYVRIVSARFDVSLPGAGAVCPATLTIEFLWDWRVRRPNIIRFAGRLYAAAFHGAAPPSTTVPAGLQRSILGADPFVEIAFAGDVPSSTGGTIVGLNEPGDAQVGFGPAQGSETRRYRITIPNFSLDFGSTGHIGLALWAQGQERIAPQRTGAWSPQPSVISSSDPRPPIIVPDIVTLASLPDASGECHARLSWSASVGAAGYFIYESTETKILLANGLSEPAQDLTLSQRLTRIKNAFRANPSRREFTRRNSKLIQGNSTDITLPRGSTSIHVFIVLGVSAGQAESNWPSGPKPDDALQAFAAPRVVAPAPPTIEAAALLDRSVSPPLYRTRLHIATRKGARVKRIDLHRVRVDDAAKRLETMGPPILTLTPAAPGWTVNQTADVFGTNIVSATGTDTPAGSWKRVWYRASAWSERDDLRGNLAGKSPASNSCWVVIPPGDAPHISPLAIEWPPGGALADVLVKWNSAAPARKTPLGHHTIAIRARAVGADEGTPPLIAINVPLAALPQAQPATGSGAWRAAGGSPGPSEYQAIIRRAAITDKVQLSIQITDPVGRSSERLVTIDEGPILPDPKIENVTLTTSVVPPGRLLQWTSDAPLGAGDAGPYTLRIAVLRPPKQRFPPLGPFLPQPPILVELGLEDVPLDEAGPITAGADPVRVRRNPGAGPTFSYYVFCRVPVTKFIIRLTAPDGRLAEHIETVS